MDVADRALDWLERARAAPNAPAAIIAYGRSIADFARASGARHPDTAHARVERAQVRLTHGAAARGLRELRSAAATLLATRGGGTRVAELAVHAALVLATALRDAGHFDDARSAARTALARARRRLAGTWFVARAHNELGVIGKLSGRFAEAARHYAAARPLYERLAGPRSREMASLFHNLGGLAHARGDFAAGELLARRAVEIGRRVLARRDPELVAHEVAHAALLDGLGRHREAIAIYRRAVAAFTAHYGRVHFEVASALHNLAASEHACGRLAIARRVGRESLALHERLLGRGHPDVGLALFNLAHVDADRGEPRLAVRALRRARAIFARTLGAKHPHARACDDALARHRAMQPTW